MGQMMGKGKIFAFWQNRESQPAERKKKASVQGRVTQQRESKKSLTQFYFLVHLSLRPNCISFHWFSRVPLYPHSHFLFPLSPCQQCSRESWSSNLSESEIQICDLGKLSTSLNICFLILKIS